jgi:hypothetical protein
VGEKVTHADFRTTQYDDNGQWHEPADYSHARINAARASAWTERNRQDHEANGMFGPSRRASADDVNDER